MIPQLRLAGSGGVSQNQKGAVPSSQEDGFPTFSILCYRGLHIWYHPLDLPLDWRRYPILVLRYRAREVASSPGLPPFAVGLVDRWRTSIPLSAVDRGELSCDGAVHTIRRDLRELELNATLEGIAVCVEADGGGAAFDLISLHFEAEEPQEALPPEVAEADAPHEDEPIRVKVVNQQGEPVGGAVVVVDSERLNWAFACETTADGLAEIVPLANEAATHMLRVEHDGFVPVEMPTCRQQARSRSRPPSAGGKGDTFTVVPGPERSRGKGDTFTVVPGPERSSRGQRGHVYCRRGKGKGDTFAVVPGPERSSGRGERGYRRGPGRSAWSGRRTARGGRERRRGDRKGSDLE